MTLRPCFNRPPRPTTGRIWSTGSRRWPVDGDPARVGDRAEFEVCAVTAAPALAEGDGGAVAADTGDVGESGDLRPGQQGVQVEVVLHDGGARGRGAGPPVLDVQLPGGQLR